jgi:hypothetical protein
MTVDPGDNIRIAARMRSLSSGDIVNVLHLQHAGSTGVDDETFLGAVMSYLNAIFNPIANDLTNSTALYDYKVDIVEFISGKETITRSLGISTWTGNGQPADPNEALPPGTAAIVNLRTVSPQVVGRKYFGVFTEARQNQGQWTSGTLDHLVTATQALLLGFTVSGQFFVPGVMSKKLATFINVTEGVVNAVVGYQRRRRQGRGS